MGRPSAAKQRNRPVVGTLRVELQRHIERGQCAYCRTPARPNKPLTREHVIPRARGGRRKDVRIIVPACARCNHNRGCQDLIPFLLSRPQRLSSFLDYLSTLSPESVRELDPRIFAELYVAVAILKESAARGAQWRIAMERMCSGRSLHRRRYAARRAVGAVSERLDNHREHAADTPGPSCLLPRTGTDVLPLHLDEPLDRLASRVLSVMALLWHVPAEVVEREMARALAGSAMGAESIFSASPDDPHDQADPEGIVPLDGWKSRPKRRRNRIDRRSGRPIRTQRVPTPARGRAA